MFNAKRFMYSRVMLINTKKRAPNKYSNRKCSDENIFLKTKENEMKTKKADRSVRALYVHWTKTNSGSGTIVLAENILSKTLRINADVYCIFVTTRSSALITKRITLSQFIVFLSQFFYSSAPLISFVFANVMFITLVYSHSFVKCSCSPAYNVWMMHSQL